MLVITSSAFQKWSYPKWIIQRYITDWVEQQRHKSRQPTKGHVDLSPNRRYEIQTHRMLEKLYDVRNVKLSIKLIITRKKKIDCLLSHSSKQKLNMVHYIWPVWCQKRHRCWLCQTTPDNISIMSMTLKADNPTTRQYKTPGTEAKSLGHRHTEMKSDQNQLKEEQVWTDNAILKLH